MPRRTALALLGALAAAALLFLTWYAAFHVGLLQRADERILSGFADLERPRVDPIASFIARLCNPNPYLYFAAVPVLVALARRRPRAAVAIAAILFGANLTTQLLKPLLADPRAADLLGRGPTIAAASWPSGHATAALSLALVTVLAAPARWRPLLAALGAAFAVAVSYSFLTLGWHYPSDVFGGFLVAVAWTLLGAAAIFAAEHRPPRAGTREHRRTVSLRAALLPPAGIVVIGLAFVGLIALARPHAVLTYARSHTTFMVGASAIGALALVLATGVMLLSASLPSGSPGSAQAPTAAPRRRWPPG